jgi:methylenetetrahydrofolate dehydrogenase (NAD+)
MMNSRRSWRAISRFDAQCHRRRSSSSRLLCRWASTCSSNSSLYASSGGEQETSYSSQLEPPLFSASASSRIVDVAPLAEAMRTEVREYTRRLQNTGNSAIRLVGIVATNTTAASTTPYNYNTDNDDEEQQQATGALVYSEQIAETFAQDGIEYEMHSCTARHPMDVEAVIRQMNQQNDVHGILVFYPIFKSTAVEATAVNCSSPPRYYLNRLTGVRYKTPDDYLRDLVSPAKDVEGLRQKNHNNINGRLFRARGGQHDQVDVYVPCTAQAVRKILAMYHSTLHQPQQHDNPVQQQQLSTLAKSKRWLGCTATVVNRSEICGLPLAALLALEGATVYSVDESSILEFVQQPDESSRTGSNAKMRRSNKKLEECLMESSIIVTGVPSPDFALPNNVIQRGTTVINVSEYPNVDQDALLQRPGIQFIPQIGKVTVAALEQNLIRLHQQQQRQCQQEQ